MRRCKKCGCPEFFAHQRIYTNIIVDGDNHFLSNISSDGSNSVYDSDDPYGQYECKICGAEYDDLEELWFDESEYVGYLYFIDSDERIAYKTESELIRQYQNAINFRGPLAQRVESVNDKNLVLKYKLSQIMANEYGYDCVSFNDWNRNRLEKISRKEKGE